MFEQKALRMYVFVTCCLVRLNCASFFRIYNVFFPHVFGFSIPCEAPALPSVSRHLAVARPSRAFHTLQLPVSPAKNRYHGHTRRAGSAEISLPGDKVLDTRDGGGS